MLDGGAICKQLVHRAQAKTLARQARVQLWNAKRQTRGRQSSAGSALQARNLHAQGRNVLRLHKLNSYLSLVMTCENVWRTNRFWKAIFCQAPNPNRAKTARSGICDAVCISRLSVTPVRDSKVQSALRPIAANRRWPVARLADRGTSARRRPATLPCSAPQTRTLACVVSKSVVAPLLAFYRLAGCPCIRSAEDGLRKSPRPPCGKPLASRACQSSAVACPTERMTRSCPALHSTPAISRPFVS